MSKLEVRWGGSSAAKHTHYDAVVLEGDTSDGSQRVTTGNADKIVTIIGKASVDVDTFATPRKVNRGDVQLGDVFTRKSGGRKYMALGTSQR